MKPSRRALSACVFIAVLMSLATTARSEERSSDGTSSSELVVATGPVRLETNTKLFSVPIEANRGEVWQVVKRSRKKVVLTFGPDDIRRQAWERMGQSGLPTYRIGPDDFAGAFVAMDQWEATKTRMAEELSSDFPELSLEERVRLVNGEVWVGMSEKAARVAVGDRILRIESIEDETGVSQEWKVGAFGLATMTESIAKEHVNRSIWFGEQRDLETVGAQQLQSSLRLVLLLRDGKVVSIKRRQ